MKTPNKLMLIGLWLLSLTVVSCSSDDSGDKDANEDVLTNSNSLKINGETYAVMTPTLLGVSSRGEGHAAVAFPNTNATGDETNILTIDFDYTGDRSVDGDYSYPAPEGQKGLTTLTNYLEFVQINNETSVVSFSIKEGSFSIKHNENDNYTASINVIVENENGETHTFEGEYTGDFVVQFNNF